MSLETADIGGKAARLVRLREAGLPVPTFVAFGGTRVAAASATADWAALAEEAVAAVPAASYAVRSSGALEDAAGASLAGAFTTEVAVSADGVAEALRRVAEDAQAKLGAGFAAGGFGVIVQAFVEPSLSGVAFTRHPVAGRETVVEWHAGRGDALVSGHVAPERVAYFRSGVAPTAPFPEFGALAMAFSLVEELFGAPQDIEWCVADGKWFLLQSRPITTRALGADAADAALDALVPSEDFLFEKTGVSEIAPRPSALTLDVLRGVYAADGPVSRAYRGMGVSYEAADFLRIVGNQLYVDREAEARTVMPAYGRVGRPRYEAGPVRLRGFWRSISNGARLAGLVVTAPSAMAERLRPLLAPPRADMAFPEALAAFMADYALIFEINLYAERAVAELSAAAKPWGGSVAALLSGDAGEAGALSPPAGLVGNGFDLADQSAFSAAPAATGTATRDGETARAPEAARAHLRMLATRAAAYARLRECGRWLTVRLMNQLRSAALAAVPRWGSPTDVLFATLEELLGGAADEARCAARREEWARGNAYTFPARLSGRAEGGRSAVEGLSTGVAHGVLVARAELAAAASDGAVPQGAKPILWTEELTPDLVNLFDRVSGIVAARGGLLAHCAIVARERGVPVAVNEAGRGLLGQTVRMDGSTGACDVAT